jgi:hypothetical protein
MHSRETPRNADRVDRPPWPGTIKPVRHGASTVIVLTSSGSGPLPGQVLAAVERSMNVALIRPDEMTGVTDALRRAGRAAARYALVPADPLAELAASWQAMWDVARQQGSAAFELEAARVLAAWRAGQFELPDYYLVLAADPLLPASPALAADQTLAANRTLADRTLADRTMPNDRSPAADTTIEHGADFYLGPLRSVRPHRVAAVAPGEPAEQASGVLRALGSLQHGPWWPGLDDIIATARNFYPGALLVSRAR